jgi:thiol-disulfide isomerase/thioredoxin
MKALIGIACAFLVAIDATAQSPKKFAELSDIQSHFDETADAAMLKINKDRLAALDAFVKDAANKDKADLAKAKFEAARLKVEITTKTEKSAATITAAYAAFLEVVDRDAIQLAFTTTGQVVEALVGIDAIEDAKGTWTALGAAFGEHPRAGGQIKSIVEGELTELALIGQAPKAFAVKDLEDKDLSLEMFKGKVVLIDFWATWCGPCIAELPNVIEAYKKYHGKGFEIVGISLDKEDKTVLEKFLASHPDMKWPQFYDGKFWKNELAQLYEVKSIPATYLLDQDGKVYRVGLRGKALDKAIEKLLAKSAGGGAKKS